MASAAGLSIIKGLGGGGGVEGIGGGLKGLGGSSGMEELDSGLEGLGGGLKGLGGGEGVEGMGTKEVEACMTCWVSTSV